eukprot:scaffold3159_cov393-Prasinococcus_capsulatus_cf.AAC.12
MCWCVALSALSTIDPRAGITSIRAVLEAVAYPRAAWEAAAMILQQRNPSKLALHQQVRAPARPALSA